MIEFINVSKDYGTKQALKTLSLTIKQGEIFGFLGHNGAGKSTTIKSLVSIIQPSNGSITVDGLALAEHRQTIKKKSRMSLIHQIFFYSLLQVNIGI